ncbi:DUF2975 domain-containing protein [Leifsonia sp. Leaf264]|uniref:DUF2975 domain-containing protein n=1 Tax=Leifsonia sp. Leaf264 TaxID=1736314 RepID=UPI0006FFF627|nr:DUF2975 domain-containing protein [Leifsonia sp. Leaf264]KQO96951.1 hypothetical protein ASF30_18010 [Leifsonia sp. Leaf264]
MRTIDRVVLPLRILLVVVFAGLLIAQTLSLPGTFRYLAEQNPELGAVPWLLLAFAIFEVLCVQVVIVCTWRLLTLVRADRIFSDESFGWVDGIVWALLLGWVALAVVSAAIVAVIYVTPELRDPGTPILLIGIVLIGGVVVLTMVVMRALLRQAAVLRADLADVI